MLVDDGDSEKPWGSGLPGEAFPDRGWEKFGAIDDPAVGSGAASGLQRDWGAGIEFNGSVGRREDDLRASCSAMVGVEMHEAGGAGSGWLDH